MNEEQPKIYFYIAIAALILAATAFGLAFSPLGVYSLIASIILELCSLSFLATQKKRYNFRAVLYLTIAAYTMLVLSAAFFIGGLIYSSMRV